MDNKQKATKATKATPVKSGTNDKPVVKKTVTKTKLKSSTKKEKSP